MSGRRGLWPLLCASVLGVGCQCETWAGGKKASQGLAVDCRAQPRPISPLIYGVAFDIQAANDTTFQELGVTARRWGGNHTSRYNWKLGNAWNTASDWYFRNTNYTDDPAYSYQRFLEQNRAAKVHTALTLPLIGWVAKDTRSVGFPRSVYPEQRAFDPFQAEAGDGMLPTGKPAPSLPPTQTSVEAPPEFIAEWVRTLRPEAKDGPRPVDTYILDNEPMLWHQTHRDVHPAPVGYDELLDRTVRYATAVRKADPEAVIAGPALWGWSAYFYSAQDLEAGTFRRPDRRRHGDEPLLPWLLTRLREHEKKTGVRLLDVLDVHYYPQGEGMGLGDAGRTDAKTAALRLRSTRSLWDPDYKDESWIDDEVRLLPRLQEWVAKHYPGLKIQLGEYNFGAEQHLSGGLAQAEALGRFGQHGLWAAYMWKYPPKGSPAYWAFRAFRNFDGAGATFEALSLPTTSTRHTSLFAARSEDGTRLTLVALNLDPLLPAEEKLSLPGCGAPTQVRAFRYSGGEEGLVPLPLGEGAPKTLQLPASSMTVLEYRLEKPAPPKP